MSNKQMTAVEWFYKWFNDNQEATTKEGNEAFQQAKELEKQQIIDAYHINPLEAKWGNIGIDYYTETYGGQNNEQ